MSASGTDVLYEGKEGVGCMTLNRPDKFNCISTGLMNGVDAAMDAFEADNTVRVVLLTGAGKTFCTGADLDEVMAARQNKDDLKKFIGHIFAGKYLDCGTMKGYINSSIEISKI